MHFPNAAARSEAFCNEFGLRVPILLAPMAGACPPSHSIAVANSGGLGACGALLMQPEAIKDWASKVRSESNGAFQLNLWIPDPPPARDLAAEELVRSFLAQWGPAVGEDAGSVSLPNFADQCEAMLAARPAVISSIMGLYPPEIVERMKARGIKWIANATTVTEAKLAEAAGADAIVAQGMEAGGHRGAFEAEKAETTMVGLFGPSASP
jgi:nitronate monooxygenase